MNKAKEGGSKCDPSGSSGRERREQIPSSGVWEGSVKGTAPSGPQLQNISMWDWEELCKTTLGGDSPRKMEFGGAWGAGKEKSPRFVFLAAHGELLET